MNIDEIEGMPLSELSEREFEHVALGILNNSDLQLIRADDPEAQFMLSDGEGFEWIVSRTLTASQVFKLSTVIAEGEQHPHGEYFRLRPFYDMDRRKLAANDKD